jgi:dihydrodipicolinate synthase/N-acetylneuraminate lyase
MWAGSVSEQKAGGVRLFSGVGVALVTIFDSAGEVDVSATAGLAKDLIERGMRAVLVAGTTGEAGKLTPAERVTLIEAIRAALPADVPVLAGTGALATEDAVALTKAAVAAGADAVLAYPPPGCGADPAGGPDVDPAALGAFFGALATAAGDRPVLAYHIPWISAPGVPVDQLAGLPIVGVKDSSGNPDRLLDELAHYEGATYVGSSALLALAGPMGGAGAILAIANVEPERCAAAFGGDAAAQRALADTHLAVRAGGPAALKRILAERTDYSPASRV